MLKKAFNKAYNKWRKLSSLHHKANKAREKKDYETEYKLWFAAYNKDKNDLHAAIATIMVMRKLKKKNLNEFTQEISNQFPKEPAPYRELAKNYLKKDLNKTIQYLKQAYELNIYYKPTAKFLVKLLIATNQINEALKVLYQQLKKYPNDIELVSQEAICHTKKKNFIKVSEIVKNAIDKNELNDEIFQAVGDASISLIADCIDEFTPNGSRIPISLRYRKDYLTNPAKVLEPWNKSYFFQQIEQFRERLIEEKESVKRRATLPTKPNLLFVSDANWNFMQGIVETFHADESIEVRTLEFNDVPKADFSDKGQIIGKVISCSNEKQSKLFSVSESKSYYKKLIDWADVIYIEWCNYPAVWLSHYCPPEKKIVIRLHSYEAFTFWPHLVNWANVDVLINVATHIQGFLQEQIDIEKYNTNLVTLPNFNRLEKYNLPKKEGAYKTLGLIGYNNYNKGPLMALEVLNQLVREDKEWCLLLVGHPFPEKPKNEEEEETKKKFNAYIKQHQLTDHIKEYGFTDKLEEAIQEIGFILSLSEREGTHESAIQSMAGGSIPIIYDWPMVKKWGGASTIFNSEWIINSADEAVNKIKEYSSSIQVTKEKAIQAKQDVAKYDSSKVMPQLKEILFI